VKLLVDECLSPRLVLLARARDLPESTHVTWLGLSAKSDLIIARRAVADGFVLVTHNAGDFRAIYRRVDLHAGLICLHAAHGTMSLSLQERLFIAALEALRGMEPANQMLDVTSLRDGTIRVERRTVSS